MDLRQLLKKVLDLITQVVLNFKQKDSFCPSDEYKKGEPEGECYGVGHYMCHECIYQNPIDLQKKTKPMI